MANADKTVLLAALTPEELRWAADLADKLPDDVDLTFEEIKILTRIPIQRWPKRLLAKIRNVIDLADFLNGDHEGQDPS